MRILLIDCHIAVFQELQYIVNALFPSAHLECILLSNHSHLIGRKKLHPKFVNSDSWLRLDDQMIRDFQDEYDSYLSSFDLFLTGYPASFCLLYEKYNKPILIYNCVRYDLPFCWSGDLNMLSRLNESIYRLNQKGLLSIVSNNLADHDYIRNGIPHVSSTIISTCGAYKKIDWFPLSEQCLGYSPETKITSRFKGRIVTRSQMGSFTDQALGWFKGIVHLPYEVSTMSMYEQYQSGIPLIFPSLHLFQELWTTSQIPVQSRYWLHHSSIESAPPSQFCTNGPGSIHWWSSRADWLHGLTNVNLFDSFEQLDELLRLPSSELNRLGETLSSVRLRTIVHHWSAVFSDLGIPS
jgi:hypothetical protein